jgi:1-aminocyclopropane-1-carboxylate deaminase
MVITKLPDLKNISLDSWNHPEFQKNELNIDVLRLDKIHPDISGNKWFKLKYYFERARKSDKQKLISFGGAYSSHLLALAAASEINGFSSIGYIRGEKPRELSHILQAASGYGMELRFLTRSDYDQKKKSLATNPADESESEALLIPEGGTGMDGIRGAEEILSLVSLNRYSHICCAVGTGTTLTGIINSAAENQKIIGVSVLKGTSGFGPLNIYQVKNSERLKHVQMIHSAHFGGYAKKNQSLIDFMNQVFEESAIPTDFVYTGKLFFSIYHMIAEKSFPSGSRILIIHSGGLQGNLSLAPGLLQF